MGIFRKVKEGFYIAADKLRRGFVKVRDAFTQFLSKVLDMMRTVINKLETKVRGVILGASHFVRKIGNKYQEGTKNYSLEKEIGEWNEITVTRDISMEDLPFEYKTMEGEFEIDDTAELEAVLEA